MKKPDIPADPIHRNTKRTGELSEAAFLLKAESLGFHVSRPWGDSERYDFILDAGPRLWRVQLKCTEVLRARGYDIQPIYAIYGQGKAVYTADQIDVLVAHIIPKDAWYVLPVDAFAPSKSLRLYPDIECKRARWEKYREAWDLFRNQEPTSQDAATRAALEAGAPSFAQFAKGGMEQSPPSPNCRDHDWRRCLLHAVGQALRHTAQKP